jgi:AmmeMemoRadiSam system protein B
MGGDVSQYIEREQINSNIQAVIVPHAGYKYCGDVLGKVYS